MTEKEYKEQIYKKAADVSTFTQLKKLMNEIESYGHDYGTIVYGCMAAMKAAFNVVNRSKQGGITGFQAGCLGWECVHEFMSTKPPCRLLDYNDMLYPQYAEKFDKVISQSIFDHLRSEAEKNLSTNSSAHERVRTHWKMIADGNAPFGYAIKSDEM